MRGRAARAVGVAAGLAVAVAACTVVADGDEPTTFTPADTVSVSPSPSAVPAPAPTPSPSPSPLVVAYADSPDERVHATASSVTVSLVERAELVVTHDAVHADAAAVVARQLGVPAVRVDGAGIALPAGAPADLVTGTTATQLPVPWPRLGVAHVLHVGPRPPRLRGVTVHSARTSLPPLEVRTATAGATVVSAREDSVLRSIAAATAGTFVVATGDVRGDPGAIAVLAGTDGPVVGLGTEPVADLRRHVATARTGMLLPTGDQLLDGSLLVALYGSVDGGALGVLGEQDVPATVALARETADAYVPHTDLVVVPALEVIVTVASAEAGADGDYSREGDPLSFVPLIEAAAAAGQYVVLDLQPGREDFTSQAQAYAQLLAYPHVGLALDPEWRIGPTQRHLVQVGRVQAAEVQATADWLADFVTEHALPQKLFLLHQFQLQMLRDRDSYDTSRDELAWVIQMDGQGGQFGKDGTWSTITRTPPEGVAFGWKHFYDEDVPGIRSPEATMRLSPTPVYVSYQ